MESRRSRQRHRFPIPDLRIRIVTGVSAGAINAIFLAARSGSLAQKANDLADLWCELQCEHILPESRGGRWAWMNLVTACGPCNGRKADRTPEEAGMPLVYLPYVPSRFEDFLLEGRHIRADVHEWLAARLPKGSRLS